MKHLGNKPRKYLFIGLILLLIQISFNCYADSPESKIVLEDKYFWMVLAAFPRADKNQEETDYIINLVYDIGMNFNSNGSFYQLTRIQNVRPETWVIIESGDWEIIDKDKLAIEPFGQPRIIYHFDIYEKSGILFLDILDKESGVYEHIHYVKYPREIYFGKSNEIYIRPRIGTFTRVLNPWGF